MAGKTEDHDWQWEQWLEKVQIRAIDNFTETGWGLDSMPEDTHKVIHDHFVEAWASGNLSDEPGTAVGRITGVRKMVRGVQKYRRTADQFSRQSFQMGSIAHPLARWHQIIAL